jgi:hypothetical protein
MPFPELARLEVPILLELKALGGEARPRSLYRSLTPYFPSLTHEELKARTRSNRSKWSLRVQRAARRLARQGEIERKAGVWRLTERGRERAAREDMPIQLFLFSRSARPTPSHEEIKRALVRIGEMLGKFAVQEYREGAKRYDVVWKDSELSPRASHVFEVQNRGNLENSLAKLKHAYETQRSRPFLVIADEGETRRVESSLRPYLMGYFHEIGQATVFLSFEEVQRLYNALDSAGELLRKLLSDRP